MSRHAPVRPDYAVVLDQLEVLEHLAPYQALAIGTPPLGLQVADSDIDIACHVPAPPPFKVLLRRHYGTYPGFELRDREMRDDGATLCRFTHLGWPIEIFGQAIPLERQYGVRHFRIEQRLLHLFGATFRTQVMELRHRGLKTEPAFAVALGLSGDPYEALLELESLDDQALKALRAAAG